MLSTQSLHLVEDRHRTLHASAAAHRAATRDTDQDADRRTGLLGRLGGAWTAVRARRPGRSAPARPLAARPTSC